MDYHRRCVRMVPSSDIWWLATIAAILLYSMIPLWQWSRRYQRSSWMNGWFIANQGGSIESVSARGAGQRRTWPFSPCEYGDNEQMIVTRAAPSDNTGGLSCSEDCFCRRYSQNKIEMKDSMASINNIDRNVLEVHNGISVRHRLFSWRISNWVRQESVFGWVRDEGEDANFSDYSSRLALFNPGSGLTKVTRLLYPSSFVVQTINRYCWHIRR